MKHLLLITLITALTTLVHSQPSVGQIGIPVWTANGTSTVWLTPQNNKVIGVNGSGNLELVAGGGSSTLGALSDVALTSLTSGQLLRYNGAGWVNWTPTYAPTNSPTFTGAVTIPSGASIAGYLTSATAASTYQTLGVASLLGSPAGNLNMNAGADNDLTLDLGGAGGSISTNGGHADTQPGGNGGSITTAGNLAFAGGSLILNSNGSNDAGSLNTQAGGTLTMGTGNLAGGDVSGTILTTDGDGSGLTNLTNLDASNLTSGTVPTARLGTGTADSTTYLRGDQTWQTITGGITSITGTANQITVTGTTTPTLSLPATITGLTSVTSTTFVGALTGTASGNAVLGANTFTGAQYISNTTASTSNATGALRIAGGLGVTGAFHGGGDMVLDSTWGVEAATGDVLMYGPASLSWGTNLGGLGNSKALSLWKDASDIVAQRRGTNAQASRIYNTYTSATIYERAAIEWASNILRIGTQKGSGGGTARDMILISDDTERARINSTGLTIASGLNLVLGNTAVAETPTATHTIIIKDAAGVSYRVLAIPVP